MMPKECRGCRCQVMLVLLKINTRRWMLLFHDVMVSNSLLLPMVQLHMVLVNL